MDWKKREGGDAGLKREKSEACHPHGNANEGILREARTHKKAH